MKMHNPAHPGQIIKLAVDGLRQETGKPYGIEEIAKSLNTTRKTLSTIINGRQGVTPEMAIKLGKMFNSDPDFWLRLQNQYDLAHCKVDLRSVKVLPRQKAVA